MAERLQQPPPDKMVPELNTPDHSLGFFREVVSRESARFQELSPIPRGTKYSTLKGADKRVITAFPDLYFLKETVPIGSNTIAGMTQDAFVVWNWATAPDAESIFNAEISFLGDAVGNPVFARIFTVRRDLYEANPVMEAGLPLTALLGVEITDGGTGYTTATAVLAGAGNGAEVKLVIADGVIIRAIVTKEGTGFTATGSSITIDGDGEDATASLIIQPANAVLTSQKKLEFPESDPYSHDYVRVLRVYEVLPGPWIPFGRWDDNLGEIEGRRRAVLTGYAIEQTFSDGTRGYSWRPVNGRYVMIGSEPSDTTLWFVDIVRGDYNVTPTAVFYEVVDDVVVGHWKFERVNNGWALIEDNPEGSTSVPPTLPHTFEFFNPTQHATSTPTSKTTFEAREGSSVVSIETHESWGDVPYDHRFAVEIPDRIPPDYRDLLPTRTSEQTEVGIAERPELGPGELARSSTEVNKFWRHETVTDRDLTALPITRHDFDLDFISAGGAQFGGVFDNARTLAEGPQEVEEGFLITKSSVLDLGNNLTLRETKKLSGSLPARLLLTHPGSGFATAPAVVFGGGDTGTGAAGTAVLSTAPVIPPTGEPGGTFDLNLVNYGDANGVFYFLGARYNGGVWRNPATAGNIAITSASNPSYPLSQQQLVRVCDRSSNGQVTVIPRSGGGHYIAFDMGVGKRLKANRITIRQADPRSPGTIQRNLRVEGFNDFVTPFPLGDAPIPQVVGEWSQAPLDNSVGFRYFRVYGIDDPIPGVFPTTFPALSLGEIEFYGELEIVPGLVRQHSFDGDTNGVFHYLGAAGNGGVWRNPHTFADIECAADALVSGTLAQLVDREPSNIVQDASASARSYYFDLLEGRSLICSKMSFRQRTDFNAAAAQVSLQGTNDPTFVTNDWNQLASFVTPTAKDTWKTIDVPLAGSYRRFRLVSQTDHFAIGEMELYGALTFPPDVIPDPSFSVEGVTITNGGSGYAVPPVVNFVGGGGTGAAGTAVLNDDGEIESVLMTNHGSGYISAPTVSFSSVGLVGSGAAATSIIDGQVQGVSVEDGGTGYETPPDVVFSGGGGGSGAVANAVLGFGLASIAVTNPGNGDYSFPPDVLIDPPDASAHSVLSFKLDSITLDDGGSGYSTPPTVDIDAPTGVDGVQATAHAVMGTGGVPATDTFTYGSDGDANGVLNFLGENYGLDPWSNPHDAGRVTIISKPVGGAGNVNTLVNRAPSEYSTGGTDGTGNEWFEIDLGPDATLLASKFSYRYRNDTTNFAPLALKWEGSLDGGPGGTWVELADEPSITPVIDGWVSTDAAVMTTAYRYFRVRQIGVNSSGSDHFSAGEIELYGDFSYITSGIPTDEVASIVIDDPGYGYLTEPAISFTGDGTDAAATAVLEATGYVDSIVIDDPGVFTATPDVTFDGDGTAAAGTANLSVGGSVIEVNVTDPGTNYQSAPDVAFEPVGADPGTGAAGTASIEGEVTGFTVTNGGAGYDVAPSVEIPGDASATANIAGGEVVSLTLTNPGSGYAAPPPVVFFALGGPEGVATIAFGVNNINVTNGGSGYAVEPPVEIVGNGRSASARAILGRSLLAIEVVAGGDNYGTPLTLGISAPGGNGGAAGTIQRSFGIESATVSDGGSGYTSDPEVTAPAPVGGTDAIFQAIRGLPIREVVMTNPGSGYATPPTVGFAAPFPVAGTTAAGDAILGFGVASVAMDNMGTGYQTAPLVELRSQASGGGGATAIAELLGRSLASIFVDNGGSGYTSPPTVIVGDGSNATAHAVLTGDVVTSIVVDTPGSGYQAAPEIHILNDGGGTGAHGQAVLTANQDMRIVVTNPGAGYEDVPDVILTGGGGTGAAATATLTTEGGVKRVELSEEGSDYTTDTPVAFTGGGGTGAAGTATRDLAAAGPVALIAVLQAGSGYIAATVNLVITGGGGSDAVGTAVKKTLGSIKSITLTNTGSGFEAPPVVAIGQALGGLGTGAVLRAILAPTGRVKRVIMTSAGEGYTVAPTVSFPATDGSGAAATAFLKSTGSIETLTLTVPGGPFSVAPLVTFLPPGDEPLATALYLLAQIWPTLEDEITDPTDKLIVLVTKDIVPKGTPLPPGYSEGLDLNKYRRIQIVSKLDLTRLPPPETYLTTQHVGLPNQLLAVTPVWSTRIAESTAINRNHTDGSASAAAEISGSILVLKTGGFRGAAIARVQRVHFNGIPPDAAVPLPTIIRPSTGTAFIKGGANSVARSGSPNGPILNFYGQPAQIGDLLGYNPIDGLPYYYAGGLGLVGPNITTSSSSSISSNLQIVDISDVLTAGISLSTINGVTQNSGSGDPGALDVEASVNGTFGVSMPPSCPASLQPGSTILQEVGVEKRRFNLYVRTFVYVIVPGNCEAVGGGSGGS